MAQKDRGLKASELERETRKLAQDLAFCARAPVSIQLVGGNHIAFTYNCEDDKKQHQIPIVMNPDTLKKVRNKEQAIKIWRGIGIHELAHHLFPASAQYQQANKEGFRHLFNLVDDEQNERRARAMDPEWGSCLQSVCAHVFSKNRRTDHTLSPGIIDGEKEGRKPRGIAATKVYAQRWNQFAFHFRLHVPEPRDAIVAEALTLVEKDFKDLSKPDLLDLTRRIHEVLSRGIEMPKPNPADKAAEPDPEDEKEEEESKEKPDKKDEKKEDEKKEEDKEADKEEPEDSTDPDAGWGLKALLTSKWMLIPLALFITGWVLLFLRSGTAFWLQAAIIGVVAVIGVGVILFMRRALIKRLLAAAKARAARASGGSAGTSARDERSERIGKLLAQMRMSALLVLGVAGMLALFHLVRITDNPMVGLGLRLGALSLLLWLTLLSRRITDDSNARFGKFVVAVFFALFICIAVSAGFATMTVGWGLSVIGWLAMLVLLLAFGSAVTPKQGYRGSKRTDSAAGSADDGAVRGRFWRNWRIVLREKLSNILDSAGRVAYSCWKTLSKCALWVGRKVAVPFILAWRAFVWFWKNAVVSSWYFCQKWIKRGYWKLEPVLKRLWRNAFFRLAVIAVPIAALLAMLYAVAVTAAEASLWVLILLLVLLLLLLLLGYLFRRQIKHFVVNELLMPMPELMTGRMQAPLDMETEWFVQIDNVVPISPDQSWLDENLPHVYVLAQQLRPYVKNCGRQILDREEEPDGYDLVEDAELALVGETSIFVNDDIAPRPSVHIEVALDCSSSMESPTATLKQGQKFLLGKFFALVLEQAVINLPGVSARFWGFTDKTIYDCGTPGEGRVSGLKSGGGNNDAAMLWKMGQSAAQSGKDVKILLMLSDGQPSECSWKSLNNLVLQFEQEGMIPWNFALDEIGTPAFERFFTDLVGQTMEEAIITMGETLASIAQEYR